MNNIIALLILIIGLLLIPTSVLSFEGANPFDIFGSVFTQRKVDQSVPQKIESPKNREDIPWTLENTIDDFKNLRTTYIRGVFCQQVDDNGEYKHQRHYFYNKKTQRLVEIPNVYYINDVNQLGDLKTEYQKYAEKSDTIIHNNKKYKIPTF